MAKLGFNNTWIDWIMMCVESVVYQVQVNNDQVGPIFPTRGLRQGDPLSPYLFIICVEGLTSLIKDAQNRRMLHGVKICRQAPVVTHLLFANDCFLFFKANDQESNIMKSILQVYGVAFGQEINYSKSEVFFSRNVGDAVRQSIAACLGVSISLGTGKYLGLPSMVGRSKKAVFSFIKDRVSRRINSWNSRNLSMAGREVLIKSVVQAIPSYCMSIFQIPHSICEDIQKMMNSFWWGCKGGES